MFNFLSSGRQGGRTCIKRRQNFDAITGEFYAGGVAVGGETILGVYETYKERQSLV